MQRCKIWIQIAPTESRLTNGIGLTVSFFPPFFLSFSLFLFAVFSTLKFP